ncbi:MAG TPA: pilus assembly protein TadG-related protein [Gaiellaceae bacterium]|jgi:hypothetical protein|nr:pilus assembly protein TadG-related protein [Gaiellaceae bacterium]
MRLRQRTKDDSGQILAVFMIILPLFFVFLLVIVDGTREFDQGRNLQTAADSVALAAAFGLGHSETTAASIQNNVKTYLTANGVSASTLGMTTSAYNSFPSCTGTYSKSGGGTGANPTNCYSNPYIDSSGTSHTDEVEVRLHISCITNIFGGAANFFTHSTAFSCGAATAHAVAGISGGGAPPAYSFVSLNTSCDNHTLLIEAGGNLVVNNNIYVDSCNHPQDAFDVFGGGSITAPAAYVVGGWELHDTGSAIHFPSGTTCAANDSGATYGKGLPAASGCPNINQPILADPFAVLASPTLSGIGASEGGTRTYTTSSYSPKQYLNGTMTNGATTFTAGGAGGTASIISAGDTVEIGSDAMSVLGVTNSGNVASVNVAHIQGTAAHPESSVTVTGASRNSSNVATLTLSSVSGLVNGSIIGVNGVGFGFDGVYTLTGVTGSPTNTVTYANTGTVFPALSVSSYSLAGGVATITTASAHGLAVGNTVTIANVNSNVNGTWTVTTVPTSTTFTFNDTPAAFGVTQKQLQSGTAILTTNPNNNLPANSTVNVSGVDPLLNGGPFTVSILGSSTVTYSDPGHTTSLNLATKQLNLGTATLTTTSANHLSMGDPITVGGVDSNFNGSFLVTAVNSGLNQFSYLDPVTIPLTISKEQLSGGIATLTTLGSTAVAKGDTVTVNLTDANASKFNGTFVVTDVNAGANTFSYNDTNTTTLTINKEQLQSGLATLTTSVATNVAMGDTVTVSLTGTNSAAFNGTFTVTAINAGAKTFSYNDPYTTSLTVTGYSYLSGKATIDTSGTNAAVGDTVDVSGVDPRLGGTFTVSNIASAATAAYSPGESLSANITATQTSFNVQPASGPTGNVAPGQIIKIDSEDMLVMSAAAVTGGPPPPPMGQQFITVTRGYLGTTKAAHNAPPPAANGQLSLVTLQSFSYPLTVASSTISGMSLSSGTITVTTSTAHNFSAGDTVAVTTGDSRFDGNVTLASVPNSTTFTYAYAPIGESVTNYAVAGGICTLTVSGTNAIKQNDVVNLSGFDTPHNFLNLGNVTVTAANASTFSVNCGLGNTGSKASGPTGGATEVTPSGIPSSGTAALATVPTTSASATVTDHPSVAVGTGASGTALDSPVVAAGTSASGSASDQPLVAANTPTGGTVTVPAFIAATSATGSLTVASIPTTSASGTATVAFPGGGSVSTNLLEVQKATDVTTGGPGTPTPYEISTGNVTLQPGTYYGGICIGAATGSDCSSTVTTGPPGPGGPGGPGAGAGTSNCEAAGGSTTSTADFAPMQKLNAAVSLVDTTITVKAATTPIVAGDVLVIDSEDMTVPSTPAITSTGSGGNIVWTIPVTRATPASEIAAHTANTKIQQLVTTANGTAYAGSPTLNATVAIGDSSITIKGMTNPIAAGQVIGIGAEDMLIPATPAITSTGTKANTIWTIPVTRSQYNTVATAHPSGASIVEVSATYSPPPNVTLAPGTYIMAGGGFSVCGSATLSAPNVMIYNTQDPTLTTGNGALGQVDFNTSGSVTLGPQTSGSYAGMTIFQDRALTIDAADACDPKHSTPADWDIALQQTGSSGPTTLQLGSFSGTIYAPAQRALFGDDVSGTANLAIITGCIFINGADSTFNFQPTGNQLFGVGDALEA